MSDNYQDELAYWMSIWDEMQKEFAENPQPANPQASLPYSPEAVAGDPYWDYQMMLLNEGDGPDKVQTDNPIHPDNVSSDYRGPSPKWINNDNIEKLEKMKMELHSLYDKIMSLEVLDGVNNSKKRKGVISIIKKKIKRLEKQIQELSDHLGTEKEAVKWDWSRPKELKSTSQTKNSKKKNNKKNKGGKKK